jgi:transposase InsO family protein
MCVLLDAYALLEETGVKISMDGKGQALDNARTERFFRTIKYDLIYAGPLMRIWWSTILTGPIPRSAASAPKRLIIPVFLMQHNLSKNERRA